MKRQAQLSQCMIVKNEEKNIEKALSWGKGIVCEQIVVDTGSTDRTVEIAEQMGAKVFHFDWIDDFSAAKNFAIEQAHGNWIAFLDADEYFIKDDLKELLAFLSRLEKEKSKNQSIIIQCGMVQLDDEGKAFARSPHCRIFRNHPTIRYINPIHEVLHYSGSGTARLIDVSKELIIYHTGYAKSVYDSTQKLQRNIALLTKQLEQEPDNSSILAYLGDSYYADGKFEKAHQILKKALNEKGKDLTSEQKSRAYATLIKLLIEQEPNNREEIYRIYQEFQSSGSICADMECLIGLWINEHGEKKDATEWLKKALQNLELNPDSTFYMLPLLDQIYEILMEDVISNNRPEAVRYGVLALRYKKYNKNVLYMLLSIFKNEPSEQTNATGTYQFLNKLYDFNDVNDLNFIRNVAQAAGFGLLVQLLA